MGKNKTTQTTSYNAPGMFNQAQNAFNRTTTPSNLEKVMGIGGVASETQNAANVARSQNMADYGDIMQGYKDFSTNLAPSTKFSFKNVSAERPKELGEAYGTLREAMPGYREFASTGGYSPTDIQELRARGMSPIRAAYGNTMMEMDRARALGGSGGAPNYIAAASKAQRELPGQMADAMTTVNAGLADAIRQGKQFGLQGITGTGSTMGGLSSQEAARMLQAAVSNQGADLEAQRLSEASRQARDSKLLSALSGRTSLYGTTPAMSATFGNQALDAWRNSLGAENARNALGQNYMNMMGEFGGKTTTQQTSQPWWQTLLSAAGSVVPYLGAFGGGGSTGVNTLPSKNLTNGMPLMMPV